MIICTMSCADHIHRAKVLARSVKKHLSNARVVFCLVEEQIHPSVHGFAEFDRVVLAKDLRIADFYKQMFPYFMYEGACAPKGHLIRYVLEEYPEEDIVIFLDSDCLVLNPFDALLNALDHKPIVLTPPQLEADKIWECHLNFGSYNGGFVAVRRCAEGIRFVEWFADRAMRRGHSALPIGGFCDQKWLNLAPIYFDVHIFKHPGYNVASWNLYERDRQIHVDSSGSYRVTHYPLAFFHFSGIGNLLDSTLASSIPDQSAPIYKLLNKYLDKLYRYGKKSLDSIPWSYDYYHSGETRTIEAASNYRHYKHLREKFENPYAASNSDFSI